MLPEPLERRRLLTAASPADAATLAAPSDLTGVSRSGNFVRLAFTDNSTQETHFVVERALVRADGSLGPFNQVATAPATEPGVSGERVFFRVPGAVGGPYDYRVRAADADGVSEPSNLVRLAGFYGPPLEGWLYYIYDNSDFSGDPVVIGAYPDAGDDYGAGSPDPRINPDAFSLEFEGYYRAEFTERYTFHTASADGIALRVIDPRDGRVLVDFDNLSARREMPATGYQDVAGAADLEAGVQYLVRVRYSEAAGDAGFRVGWSSFSTPLEMLPGELVDPIAPGGPKVVSVYVGGTEWTDAFYDGLKAARLGFAPAGYRVGLGGNARQPVPWSNLDRVSIGFDRDVRVHAEDLTVSGASGGTYAVAGFSYANGVATWVLDRPVGAERLRLDLRAAGVTGAADGGQNLDGEWPQPAWPTSGDGRPGGDFTFRVDVLPGDVNADARVNAIDMGQERARQLTSTTNPGTPASPYTPFHDLNGDGRINAVDLGLVRTRQLTRLPDGEPTPPSAPAALTLSPAAEDLFSSAPILR